MVATPPLLLYIHPHGHLNDLVIPAGALTCMNAVNVPKLGRYAFEVTEQEIRAASVIAIDVHWALALTGLGPLVTHVRRVSARVPIVVGGVTAGHYARELLEQYDVDYVIRGDAERSFKTLVEGLVAGRVPDAIANVYHRRDLQPTHARLSAAEFDATDCLTADWFPTYEASSNWDAEAFPQGRTIGVTRGCAFRCPECYGSYASTFGSGFLMRTPEGTARHLRDAAQRGLRNIRLFVAKPSAKNLSRLIDGIFEAGPYRFTSAVGFYLCMPPTIDDLDKLEQSFERQVDISFIPPREHVPALRPVQLAKERAAWRRVAERVARSTTLRLDAWTTHSTDLRAARAELVGEETRNVKVSYGAVWSVTRPTDDGVAQPLDVVRDAMSPVWTFYAARVLSPSLARLLAPFRFLDELDVDPETAAAPRGVLRGFHEELMASWRAHHLPTLPTLRFAAHQLAGHTPRTPPVGVELRGALSCVSPDSLQDHPPVALTLEHDHKGFTLRGHIELCADTRAIGLAPIGPAGDGASRWRERLRVDGLVALDTVDHGGGAALLEITVRVQECGVALLDEDRALICRGRAELGYFRPAPRRSARQP